MKMEIGKNAPRYFWNQDAYSDNFRLEYDRDISKAWKRNLFLQSTFLKTLQKGLVLKITDDSNF